MKFAMFSILYVVSGSGLMLHGITQSDSDTVLAGTGLLFMSFVLLVASVVEMDWEEVRPNL